MSCMMVSEESELLPALQFHNNDEKESKEKTDIPCLKCEQTWRFPEGKDEYLAHLFLKHRLVIADVEEIAILEDYLIYWEKQFKGYELEEFCTTMLLDQLPDGTKSKNEKYYLLSDILPKDMEVRKTLKQKLLDSVLAQHQFERTDRTFSRECLFCRDIVSGLRAEFLEHLFTKHFIQIGRPENIVFVDELIDKLRHNLEKLICIYCEKVFKDRVALKDHMRKKAHKRINPNNRAYDKFYLVNYRNDYNNNSKNRPTGQRFSSSKAKTTHSRWDQSEKATSKMTAKPVPSHPSCSSASTFRVGRSDFEQRRTQLVNNDDSDWSDWEESEQVVMLNCLFCARAEHEFEPLKQHLREEHKVDFDQSVRDLNFYQKIKLINYVRRQMCLLRCVTCNKKCETKETLLEHMSTENHMGLGTSKQWDKPQYFFPTYEDDGILCILDDDNCNEDCEEPVVRVISENPMVQINKDAERLSLENFRY